MINLHTWSIFIASVQCKLIGLRLGYRHNCEAEIQDMRGDANVNA